MIYNRLLGYLLLSGAALAHVTPLVSYADSMVPVAAEKEIMKFTKDGIEPAKLVLHKSDPSIFFVNATPDSLINLTIDFAGRRMHCASENMKFENGKLTSVKPIAPKDFALSCFPEKGSYTVEVYGIKTDGKASVANVVVE